MAALLIFLLLALPLSSCEWFRPSTTSTEVNSLWYVAQSGYADAKPALVGDTLYVGTGDGRIVARSAITGGQFWSTKVSTGRIRGGNIVSAGPAVVVSISTSTVGLDRHTGQLLWTYDAPPDTAAGSATPGSVVKALLDVRDSTVFVPAWGGSVAALDARTGNVQWQWRAPAMPFRFGVNGVTVAGNTVYLSVWHFLNATGTECEGRLVALNAATGAEQWHTVLPYSGTAVCLPGRPAVTSQAVAVLTITREVIAVDRITGAHKWTAAAEVAGPNDGTSATVASAVAAHDTIIADAGTFALRALNGATGAVLWKARYTGQINRDMTLSGSRIYAPDGAVLHVFSRSGHLLREIFQPGVGTAGLFPSSVAADSLRVYAPVDGAIWAFQPRN